MPEQGIEVAVLVGMRAPREHHLTASIALHKARGRCPRAAAGALEEVVVLDEIHRLLVVAGATVVALLLVAIGVALRMEGHGRCGQL